MPFFRMRIRRHHHAVRLAQAPRDVHQPAFDGDDQIRIVGEVEELPHHVIVVAQRRRARYAFVQFLRSGWIGSDCNVLTALR